MAEVPEKSLERYDVLDRIAVGGMAEVFLAKAYGAHGFEKTLAIKRILPELARDPEFEERFIAEAKVAVKLSHTNVVQVFDFGRFAGSLFIAMEYVDGLDLAALLRRFKERHERVPLPAAFQIAIELARGLDFAHTHGVVHRDVSPSNILLSKAGEVKIADFGIAVAAQPGRVAATGRRKVMGKWRYMSPEQARGEPLDTRSDMFSAAAVMYELFTGDKLFPGDEAEDIIRNIHDMPLPRPSEVRRGLPPRLDEILHQALARKPGDRPLRPAAMLRALTELTYESSIVTTALDVAEAVAYVVDLSTPTGKRLDDIIRAQLANLAEPSQIRQTARGERKTGVEGEPEASVRAEPIDRRTAQGSLPDHVDDLDRRTAVTIAQRRGKTGTESIITDPPPADPKLADAEAALAAIDESRPVLLPHIDSDGITRLELDATTISGAPWELRGEPPPMPGRAVEGTPPAGGRGTSGASLTQIVRARTSPPARRGRTAPVLALGVLATAAAASGAYLLTRGAPAVAPVAAAPPDAAVAEPPPTPLPALLIIETVPVGARGTAGGEPFGPTPARLQVPPGTIPVRIELAGHEPYVDDHVVVGEGQTMVLRATLSPALARLTVITDPPAAQVSLDGVDLGVTPTRTAKLTPRKGARLTLAKDGFISVTVPVDLEAGQDTRIERTLRPAPTPTGTIKVSVGDAEGPLLGDVYLGGKKVGPVGNKGVRLPLGKHRVRIVTRDGRETSLEVDVVAEETRVYTVKVP